MSISDDPVPTNGATNGHGHSDDEDDHDHESDDYMSDEAPDDSPMMEEVEDDEFPSYFHEAAGRLFASASTPYPLPIDGNEQQRMNKIHEFLHSLFGAHYVGPVQAILAQQTGQDKLVLDICTGTGRWVMDMARLFPQVYFRGFDIVPIATRYPLPRVKFELQDVNTAYRWDDATFDFVHSRFVAMAVVNFPSVIQEVARVLRPGGLFLSHEWGRHVGIDPSFPSADTPASIRFYSALNQALTTARHLFPIAQQIPDLIHDSGHFASVVRSERQVPIGAWPQDLTSRRIGAACLEALEVFAQSVKYAMLQAGMDPNDMNNMVEDFIQELRSTPGLTCTLYTVYAHRA